MFQKHCSVVPCSAAHLVLEHQLTVTCLALINILCISPPNLVQYNTSWKKNHNFLLETESLFLFFWFIFFFAWQEVLSLNIIRQYVFIAYNQKTNGNRLKSNGNRLKLNENRLRFFLPFVLTIPQGWSKRNSLIWLHSGSRWGSWQRQVGEK